MELRGTHKKFLRGLAHNHKAVVQVGQSGITDAVVTAVEQALLDHELVKVGLTRPPDKKTMARELAERSGAQLCGLIGHTVILYRPHPDEPKIVLPAS